MNLADQAQYSSYLIKSLDLQKSVILEQIQSYKVSHPDKPISWFNRSSDLSELQGVAQGLTIAIALIRASLNVHRIKNPTRTKKEPQ
jgi:hypothetical protein